MDRARASRRAGLTADLKIIQKRTSNQEGGPRVLGCGLPVIHPLPNVVGSAADTSSFLLNGVVGDGPRAHFTQSRDDRRFKFQKNGF